MKPALKEENDQVFNLNQAMIGAVTPNFRQVSVELREDGSFRVYFLLERDEPRDREEIAQIISRYEAMQGSASDFQYEVWVDSSPIHEVLPPGRGVYGRKEEEEE